MTYLLLLISLNANPTCAENVAAPSVAWCTNESLLKAARAQFGECLSSTTDLSVLSGAFVFTLAHSASRFYLDAPNPVRISPLGKCMRDANLATADGRLDVGCKLECRIDNYGCISEVRYVVREDGGGTHKVLFEPAFLDPRCRPPVVE